MNCILCDNELPRDGICTYCTVPEIFLKGENEMKCVVCGKEVLSIKDGLCNECLCQPFNPQINNKGWTCPKCNASLSPIIFVCPFCNPETKTASTNEGMQFKGKTILMEGSN
jgi:hypothetical protein